MTVNNRINPNALCGVVCDNNLWFMNQVANSLMKMNLENGEIDEWYSIEGYNLLEPSLFREMIYYDGLLVLIPDCNGHDIVFFDLQTKEQTSTKIYDDMFIVRKVIVGESLFLFSIISNSNLIVEELELRTHRLKRRTELEEIILDKLGSELGLVLDNIVLDAAFVQNMLWINVEKTQFVLELDLNGNECKIHIVGNNKYNRICNNEDKLFMGVTEKNSLLKWDITKDRKELIELDSDWKKEKKNDGCVNIVSTSNRIVSISRFTPMIYVYDIFSGNVKKISTGTKKNRIPLTARNNYPYYQFGYAEFASGVVILPCAGRSFFVIDFAKDEVKEISPMLTKKNDYLAKMVGYDNKEIIYEKKLGLENFMECCVMGK